MLQSLSNMSSGTVFTVLAGLVLSTVSPAFAQDTCVSLSQPNPIAQQYPDVPTGTLNATLAVLPISLKAARKIIPSKWKILTKPYRALLPNFPHDKYPILLQFALDHDIQVAAFNFSFPDFNVRMLVNDNGEMDQLTTCNRPFDRGRHSSSHSSTCSTMATRPLHGLPAN